MRITEASNWLMQLQAERVSETALDAWIDWCDADPGNLEEFNRQQRLLENLRTTGGPARVELLGLAESGVRQSRLAERAHARRSIAIAMAAGIIGVAMLAFWIPRQRYPDPALPAEVVHSAGRGEQRELDLRDQSHVVLGGSSVLISEYSSTRRFLRLEQGEAYFKVAEDSSRPFVVDAGEVLVTATGTAFNVRRTRERVVVSVTEGAVEIVAGGGKPPLRLQMGQEAVCWVNPVGRVVVKAVSPDMVMARWRGVLYFENETLGSVLDDINRHLALPIIATDEALREKRIVGSLHVARAEAFALSLEETLGVRVVRREDGSLLLEPRSPADR